MRYALLSLALTISCASAGEIREQFPKHGRKVVVPDTSHCGEPANYGITQIGLERTACFGSCPVYTVIIRTDGSFRYHGDEYVKKRGDWSGTLDAGSLQDVLRYISEMDYFALASEYTIRLSDLWGVYTMVATRTRKKIVYNYGDVGPAKLVALEAMIDDLLLNAKWKRARPVHLAKAPSGRR